MLLHFDKFSNNLEKNIRLIIKTQIGVSFLMSFVSIILYICKVHFYLLGFEIGNVGRDLVGFYTHPNTAGIFAAISCIFSYILYNANKNNKKLSAFLAVNVLLQLTIIVLAHSNASILIIFSYAFLELCLFYWNKRREKKRNSTVCASWLTFFPSMEGIATKLANGRFKLWGHGFEIIKNHILLGVSPAGVTGYAKYYAGITGPSRSIDDGGLHNSYIQLFAAVGVLGGITALSLIVKNMIRSIKNDRENSKYIFLCVSILIYNMFESKLFFQASFVPIIFGFF